MPNFGIFFGILKRVATLTDQEKCLITVAHAFGHQAFVFTVAGVDFEQRTVQGKTLHKDQVIRQQFDFPQVIQNRLTMDDKDKDSYIRLAQQIPFTTHRIGSKPEVFAILRQIDCVRHNLIALLSIDSYAHLIDYLQQHQQIILKPIASFQGRGIMTLFLDGQSVQINYQNQTQTIALSQLEAIYQKIIQHKDYTMSPYVVGRTRYGQSTVWRIHVVRGQHAEWQLIKYFPYVNLDASQTITNGMQGALISTREALFLEQHFPAVQPVIHAELQRIARELPPRFQTFYPYPLDALGIDVAVTEQGKVYIYELNSGAGVGFMNFPVAMAQVRYMEYLAEHAKPPYAFNFLART